MKPSGDKPSQIDRFKEAACELGCDEGETAFKEKLGRIARHKPKERPDDTGEPSE